MADEIKIPCRVWPSRNDNQNGTYDHFTRTNNNYIAEGIRCPKQVGATNVDTDLFFRMTAPIPTAIHGTAPVGKIWVTFIPLSIDNAIVLKVSLFSMTPNESVDPTAFDYELKSTVSIGLEASIEQTEVWTIDTATEDAGDVIAGRIQRLGADGADTNAGDIAIVQVLYVATSAD